MLSFLENGITTKVVATKKKSHFYNSLLFSRMGMNLLF